MEIAKVFNFINLHNGEEERKKVLENVRSNTSFRGSNLWILACAIVIASVGLNVNSTAVIIGAMLISPLMGPIIGAGFAMAIYDFELLKKSGKNLLIATLVSLVVATLYFTISPFKETQSEILARTAPNIYDVLIAFFGGLVGVIAITRVEKGNPIPGVAIATALMPPLCTAGYGLAIGNYPYFFGAIYLYIINCFFICIATIFIIKYLKYEPVTSLNPRFEKRIRYGITTLILVMIIPSFYLAYNLLNKKNYNHKIEQFIAHEFTNNGNIVIFKNVKYNTNPKIIEVAFLNKQFKDAEIKLLNQKLLQYDIENTRLEFRQDVTDLKSEILNEIGNQNKNITEKDILINNLQKELAEYKIDYSEACKEIEILFSEFKNVSMGKHFINQNTDSAGVITVILYQTTTEYVIADTEKIEKWLIQRLKSPQVKLIRYE
ncbi:MAG: DUF389 domain-containing protein [Bacteroidia bacterium]|jgi:uncharacterized hydrophobic protein (TIGR00271 family)